jgi:hypothetical protein
MNALLPVPIPVPMLMGASGGVSISWWGVCCAGYLTGFLAWALIWTIIWLVDKDYPTITTKAEIRRSALMVLLSPIWLLVGLWWVVRVFRLMAKDVFGTKE